jgi:hypothetical protein
MVGQIATIMMMGGRRRRRRKKRAKDNSKTGKGGIGEFPILGMRRRGRRDSMGGEGRGAMDANHRSCHPSYFLVSPRTAIPFDGRPSPLIRRHVGSADARAFR